LKPENFFGKSPKNPKKVLAFCLGIRHSVFNGRDGSTTVERKAALV
jgi:hypothetical protein